MNDETQSWAEEEFGRAELGDVRKTKRLVMVGGQVALRPAGKVTEVFLGGAVREGAFRLLENDGVLEDAIRQTICQAAAKRCHGGSFAYVPVDQTSQTFTDRQKTKGLGMGTREYASEGLQVMTAIAVTPEGTPQGVVGQRYWTCDRSDSDKKHHNQRRIEDKETKYWLEAIGDARAVFRQIAPTARPWFQVDRGADAWPIVRIGAET